MSKFVTVLVTIRQEYLVEVDGSEGDPEDLAVDLISDVVLEWDDVEAMEIFDSKDEIRINYFDKDKIYLL